MAEVNYFLVTKKFTYISFYFINKLLQEEMAGKGMPQIEDSNDANKQKESVKKGGVTELRLLRAYSRNGSILNGVDDDFSTPFFVFTKYLRNAINETVPMQLNLSFPPSFPSIGNRAKSWSERQRQDVKPID